MQTLSPLSPTPRTQSVCDFRTRRPEGHKVRRAACWITGMTTFLLMASTPAQPAAATPLLASGRLRVARPRGVRVRGAGRRRKHPARAVLAVVARPPRRPVQRHE